MPSDPTLVHGFAFSGYRSFTEPGVPLAPLGKVNLLAGQNNAGKSNVLRFLRDYFNNQPLEPSVEIDRPIGVLPQDWKVRLRLIMRDYRLPERPASDSSNGKVQRVLAVLRSAPGMSETGDVVFSYVLAANQGYDKVGWRWALELGPTSSVADHLESQAISPMQAVNLISSKAYISGNRLTFTAELLEALAPSLLDLPPVRIIQAFRQIRPREGTDESDVGLFDGVGLVKRLQQLESPREIGAKRADDLRAKFDRINAFVRHILDDGSARLHIPYDASTVLIERGSSVLPLDSLGTGVHQVVMLAAAATLLSDTLIGLEEPEVHLHPLLQRRLVKYLAEQTNNQYLIATHSAHLLDYEAATVFHLTFTETGSEIAPAGTPHEVAKVCADLGYRPSDLLQSNAVIWVEGPSDRIYLRCWLRQTAPELRVHHRIDRAG